MGLGQERVNSGIFYGCVLGGPTAKKSKKRKLEKEERRNGSFTTASCEYIERKTVRE